MSKARFLLNLVEEVISLSAGKAMLKQREKEKEAEKRKVHNQQVVKGLRAEKAQRMVSGDSSSSEPSKKPEPKVSLTDEVKDKAHKTIKALGVDPDDCSLSGDKVTCNKSGKSIRLQDKSPALAMLKDKKKLRLVKSESMSEAGGGNSYDFSDKEEQISVLSQYYQDEGERAIEYHQSDDYGNDLLFYMFEKGNAAFWVDPLDYGRDVNAVLDQYDLKGHEDDVRTIIADMATVECGGIYHPDNYVVSWPIGEIEQQMSGLAGTVNGKRVNDVLAELEKGLTEDELEKAARHCGGYINNDFIYVTDDSVWYAVVDTEELDSKLKEIFSGEDKGEEE